MYNNGFRFIAKVANKIHAIRSSFLRLSARYSSLILGSHPTTSRRGTNHLHEPYMCTSDYVSTLRLLGCWFELRREQQRKPKLRAEVLRVVLPSSTQQHRIESSKQQTAASSSFSFSTNCATIFSALTQKGSRFASSLNFSFILMHIVV